MLASLKEKFNKLSPTAKIGSAAFVLALLGGAGFMGYRTYQNRQVGAEVPLAAGATSAIANASLVPKDTAEATATTPTAATSGATSAPPSGATSAPPSGPTNVPQAKEVRSASAPTGSAANTD